VLFLTKWNLDVQWILERSEGHCREGKKGFVNYDLEGHIVIAEKAGGIYNLRISGELAINNLESLKIPFCQSIERFVGCSGYDSDLITADCVYKSATFNDCL
jgi:hypothetical protein